MVFYKSFVFSQTAAEFALKVAYRIIGTVKFRRTFVFPLIVKRIKESLVSYRLTVVVAFIALFRCIGNNYAVVAPCIYAVSFLRIAVIQTITSRTFRSAVCVLDLSVAACVDRFAVRTASADIGSVSTTGIAGFLVSFIFRIRADFSVAASCFRTVGETVVVVGKVSVIAGFSVVSAAVAAEGLFLRGIDNAFFADNAVLIARSVVILAVRTLSFSKRDSAGICSVAVLGKKIYAGCRVSAVALFSVQRPHIVSCEIVIMAAVMSRSIDSKSC